MTNNHSSMKNHSPACHGSNDKVVHTLCDQDSPKYIDLSNIRNPGLSHVCCDIWVGVNPLGQECTRKDDSLHKINGKNFVLQSSKLLTCCSRMKFNKPR